MKGSHSRELHGSRVLTKGWNYKQAMGERRLELYGRCVAAGLRIPFHLADKLDELEVALNLGNLEKRPNDEVCHSADYGEECSEG